MKKIGCFLLLIVIAVVAFVTNPSAKTHRENAMELLQEYGNDEFGLNSDYIEIGKGLLGDDSMDNLMSNFIDRDNYLVFSLTKINVGSQSEVVALGLFGKMWDLRTGDEIVEWGKNLIPDFAK